ncbi:hypothetical protein [Streptomyces sp. NPDC051286]|uniref:hypothetical protein n=1 Tax=Streptomyces sp. NPDC051286 TaxID=3365647 RepID=UPI0037BD7B0A
MADSASELILRQMRGEVSSSYVPPRANPSQVPMRHGVDPESQMLMDLMRGGTEEEIGEARAEHNLQTHRGQRAYEARVHQRAGDNLGLLYGADREVALQRARQQLRIEDAQAAEPAKRKAAYDAMVAITRRENEENSTEGITRRLREHGAKQREDGMDRLAKKIVAELRGDQTTAQSDAELVAKLRDIADGVATA